MYFKITKSLISTSFVTKSSSLNFSFLSDFFKSVGPSLPCTVLTVKQTRSNKPIINLLK